MREDVPKVTEAALEGAKAHALLLTDQPIVLKEGERTWTIEPAELRKMLTMAPRAAASGRWPWIGCLDRIPEAGSDEIHVDPTDATVEIGKGTVTLRPDESGRDLNVGAAVSAIEKAATEKDGLLVPCPAVDEVPAAVHTEQVQAVYDKPMPW